MLVEQIIEFKLSQTCTTKPGYFHDKTKISKANTLVIIYCQKKILLYAMYHASSTLAESQKI